MKNKIKQYFKNLINGMITSFGKSYLGKYLYTQIIITLMSRSQSVLHEEVRLVFSTPNALNQYRVDSFSTKEPETLEWINAMPKDSIFWDIGANVGLYSCYAAIKKNCRVIAFEPSVFNLELLAKNIFLNGVGEKVTIVPLPLSERLSLSELKMTSTEWGGALSTFGENFGHDGNPIRKIFSFPTIGLSMLDAVEKLNLPVPDFIKIDVDGIEHLILKGGLSVLSQVRSILIEINDRFLVQSEEAAKYLKSAGFYLSAKKHAEYFDHQENSGKYTYNQIWMKNL